MENLKKILHVKEFVAEFIGTFILVVIAKSSSLSLSALQSGGVLPGLVGSLAGGLGVMTGIIVTGAASGGHINPAVSVAMVACKKLPLVKLPAYLLGQYLGAGVGALVVLGIYSGHHAMALATYPGLVQDILPQLLDQTTATFLLILGIFSVVDQELNPPSLLVGFVVVGVSLALGPNAGAAMNPAVDFMPRVVSSIATMSLRPFTQGYYFWWIPLVLPHIGGILAGFTYRFGIKGFQKDQENEGNDNGSAKVTENGKIEETEMI